MSATVSTHRKVEKLGSSQCNSIFTCQGKNSAENHSELVVVYGEHVLSRKQVSIWCSAFSEGRTNLQNEPREGRPSSSTTDVNVARIEALIQTDRRYKLRGVSDELGIPKSVVHKIRPRKVRYRKVSARWVPKQLPEKYKLKRKDVFSTASEPVYGS